MAKPVKKTDQHAAWNKKAKLSTYQPESRNKKQTFLIYCEGQNTEPEYFKSFPVGVQASVKAVGLGRSKTSLVEKVIELIQEEEKDEDRQIWCVFDRDKRGDVNEDQDYNRAIQLAKSHGIEVAYSNDSFELWFVLHFRFIQSALLRGQFYVQLDKHLACSYEREGKNSSFCKKIYGLLLPKQAIAMANAKKLFEEHSHKSPAEQNPCTTVFRLVEELNNYLK